MITVRDKLIDEAITRSERELLTRWMSPEHDELCARQRAWEALQARNNWNRVSFNW